MKRLLLLWLILGSTDTYCTMVDFTNGIHAPGSIVQTFAGQIYYTIKKRRPETLKFAYLHYLMGLTCWNKRLINYKLWQEAAVKTASAIRLAGDYLAQHLSRMQDPFLICIATYALHLTSHNERAEAFNSMVAARTEGTCLFLLNLGRPLTTIKQVQ